MRLRIIIIFVFVICAICTNSKPNTNTSSHIRNAKFFKDSFQVRINYTYSKFDSAKFIFVKFDSIAIFERTDFYEFADFFGSEFKSDANFKWVHFRKLASLQWIKFHSNAVFANSEFDSIANFQYSNFMKTADFEETQFKNTADFEETRFDSVVNFNKSIFFSNSNFKNSYLPQILYFQNVEINGADIDFTSVRANSIPYRRCLINLTGTDVSKVKLRYELFKLMFEDSISFDLKSNIYEKLLKQTEQLGYKKSYELLDKEYKECTYLEGFKKPKWVINWLDKFWWGYGYNKEYIIKNTLIIFFIFSIINTLFFNKLSLHIYEIPELLELRRKLDNKNKLVLFIKVFPLAVYYTGYIFFGFTFSIDNLKFSENLSGIKIFNLLYFFTVYSSGIVCLSYLANYVLSN